MGRGTRQGRPRSAVGGRAGRWAWIVALGCGGSTTSSADTTGDDATGGGVTSAAATTTAGTTETTGNVTSSAATSTTGGVAEDTGRSTGEAPPAAPLQVHYLGVGGVVLRVGDDTVLTAPLYTNPSLLEVTLGDIAPDPAVVDAYLPQDWVAPAKAILVGHAHHDHLMDVPIVWGYTDDATIYGNQASGWILESFALVPSDRVVVVNDPAAPLVDRRNCPGDDPCTGAAGGEAGTWIEVPETSVRIRALCSSHPAQFLDVFHFGEGCLDTAPNVPPPAAAEWKEGSTIAYLVDFLDPDDGTVVFRVYYQDAPTEAPVGHPDASLLSEKRVDLAVVNIGSYTAVADHPEAILGALSPRFVIGGHWEDFFAPLDPPVAPIPFHPSPVDFDDRALAVLAEPSPVPWTVDGTQTTVRYVRPQPGTTMTIPASTR